MVRINNTNSNAFGLKSGVRQGCPVSPLLFALVVETMANRIRQNDKIKGIKTPLGREVKISQYADDTVLILDDSYSQGYFTNFAEAKKELKHFCNASYMKLRFFRLGRGRSYASYLGVL